LIEERSKSPQSRFIEPFGAALPSWAIEFWQKTVKIKGFPFDFSFFLLSSIQEVYRANLRL